MGFSPMHHKSLLLRAPPFTPLNHISCRTQESQEILPGTHHTWINSAPHGEAHFSTEPLEPHGIIFSGEGTQHLLYPIQTSFPAPTKTKESSGYRRPCYSHSLHLESCISLTNTHLQSRDSKEFVFCLCFSVAFALVVSIPLGLWSPVPSIPLDCWGEQESSFLNV